MPLQEFWNNDPDLLWTYRNLYMQKVKEKAKLQQEIINYQSWLQGLYIHKAIASNFAKNIEYYEKPIDFNTKPKSKKEKQQELKEKIKEQQLKWQVLLKQRSEK